MLRGARDPVRVDCRYFWVGKLLHKVVDPLVHGLGEDCGVVHPPNPVNGVLADRVNVTPYLGTAVRHRINSACAIDYRLIEPGPMGSSWGGLAESVTPPLGTSELADCASPIRP